MSRLLMLVQFAVIAFQIVTIIGSARSWRRALRAQVTSIETAAQLQRALDETRTGVVVRPGTLAPFQVNGEDAGVYRCERVDVLRQGIEWVQVVPPGAGKTIH